MRTLFNQTLPLRGLRGLHSSQSQFKLVTSGSSQQAKNFMFEKDYHTNIVHTRQYPILQDKHMCDSSSREYSSKHDLLEYTRAIHRHIHLYVNSLRKNSKAVRHPHRAYVHENGDKCQSCSKPFSVGHTSMGILIPAQRASPIHESHLRTKLLLICAGATDKSHGVHVTRNILHLEH